MRNVPMRRDELSREMALCEPEFVKVLPSDLSVERFARIAISALIGKPDLMACSRDSILRSVMECAQLGLVADGILGHAYFVPYKGKCTLIAGYRGLIELANRSGKVGHITAEVVYEADEFDFQEGTTPFLQHRRALEDRGSEIAVYAIAYLKTSPVPAFVVMSHSEVEAIRNRSPGAKSPKSPWNTDRAEMVKKTAVRRLAKYLPLSPEFVQAAVKGEYFDAGVLNGHVDLDKPGRQALPARFVPTEDVCPECQGEGTVNLGGATSPCARCNVPEGGMPSDAEIEASEY